MNKQLEPADPEKDRFLSSRENRFSGSILPGEIVVYASRERRKGGKGPSRKERMKQWWLGILERPITPEENPQANLRPGINWWVFLSSAFLILVVSLWAIFFPANAHLILSGIVGAVTEYFGWFYVLTASIVVVFMIVVAWSKSGKFRLGPPDSRPQYSLFSWGAMLFAAGIGVDLLFFSVAEPLIQYFTPPTGNGETTAAAKQAVVLTIFHYGVTGWALYALMGMAFALFAYRYDMPLAIRSALYPLIGKRIHGAWGNLVDISALLGTIFGVATSLGIGVVQLNTGLSLIFNCSRGLSVQIALIVVAVATATITAVAGIDKGIKRLCELNVFLAVILLAYVLFMGKTSFLLDALVRDLGAYFYQLPELSVETYPYAQDRSWMQSWTLFFWAWWIAWAPFVGLFLARISRGRTLRQFVGGCLLVPFMFIAVWISIFGNTALIEVITGGKQEYADLAASAPEEAFYRVLENFPGSSFLIGLAIVVGLLLFATSANSAALVMSNFSSITLENDNDGPAWMRIFWAVLTGVLTLAMLLVGGIATLQNATIVVGLPFALVVYGVMYGIFRALRTESIAFHGDNEDENAEIAEEIVEELEEEIENIVFQTWQEYASGQPQAGVKQLEDDSYKDRNFKDRNG